MHEPFQKEIEEEAEKLVSRINDYEQAVARVTDIGVGVGFLVSSKYSKPWLTLRVPTLEDYT